MIDDWITLSQACQQLGVSRPMLNKLRQKHDIKQITVGSRKKLSKLDLINKIILTQVDAPHHQLCFDTDFNLDKLQTLSGVFDLRGITKIDAYGAMYLLCATKVYLNQCTEKKLYFIFKDPDLCSYLDAIHFFRELRRDNRAQIFIHTCQFKTTSPDDWSVLQPLHLVGYRGGEKKQLDDLLTQLPTRGFSDVFCGHLGWLIGELCDNAQNHSTKPCYMMIEGISGQNISTRRLLVAIGDAGIGIAQSLKQNQRYRNQSDAHLLLHAFVSKVTSSPYPRGKGLADVMNLVRSRKSFLRVNSQGHDVIFDFSNNTQTIALQKSCDGMLPIHRGTSFAIVLPDVQKLTQFNPQQTDRDIAAYQKRYNL